MAVLDFPDPADYARVRSVFRDAGYTDQRIVETLRTEALTAIGQKQLPSLLRRTSGGRTLDTLIRLFILGVAVDVEVASRAAAPMSVEAWLALGLLERVDAGVRAAVQVRCYQELLVVWDFSLEMRGVLRGDYVMGISASTLSLASLTVRRPSRATLDLGTGSGFQAFMAAPHSERVVALDMNPRAVEMARFNARLNGLDTIECREGDLFAPVQGETFDLIVSNPPFIVSPDDTYLFLNGGVTGDEICQQIAAQAGVYLNEGGTCQFLANWAVLRETDWRERLAGWFAGSGCDVWVLRRATQPVDEYATIWIETGQREALDFADFFDRWMAYYEREGIEAIGSGLVTMRKASGRPNWFRATDAPELMGFPSGGDVDLIMETLAFLEANDDAALLDARFVVAPVTRLRAEFEPSPDGWRQTSNMLRRAAGLQYEGVIDAYGADLVGQFDGRRTLREVLETLARAANAEPASIISGGVPIVRRLAEQGFIVAAGDETGDETEPHPSN